MLERQAQYSSKYRPGACCNAGKKPFIKLCLLINLVILFYIQTENAIISYKVTFPIWNFYFLRTTSPLHPLPLKKTLRFFASLQHHFCPKFFRDQIYKSNKSVKKPYLWDWIIEKEHSWLLGILVSCDYSSWSWILD